MAKNKVQIGVEINDNGDLAKLNQSSKNAGKGLDDAAQGAKNLDRNMKGAAKTSSSTTKNFSKMSQGMGGLVGAYATVAANVFALTAAFGFLKNAADLENMKKGQVSFAMTTGNALAAVTTRLKEVSQGMLGFQEAAEAAAMGSAKGFSTTQLEELAKGALKVSNALGRSYDDVFKRLIQGASKAEPELLDELGITLRLETAMKNYSAAIDKNVDSFTDAERSQAILVETQRQLNQQFGKAEAAPNVFVQLAKAMEEITQEVTQAVLPAFKALASFLVNNTGAAFTAIAALGVYVLNQFTGIVPKMGMVFKFIGSGFTSTGAKATRFFRQMNVAAQKGARGAIKELEKQEDAIKAVAAAAKKSQQDMANKSVGEGSKSKILAKLAAGEDLGGRDKAQLDKALKAAEAQYKKFGEVKTGIFKGSDDKILKNWRQIQKDVEKTALSTAQKIKKSAAKVMIGAFKGVNKIIKGTNTLLRGTRRAADIAGKAISGALKFGGVLAIIGGIALALDEMMRKPQTFVTNIINMVFKVANGLQAGINLMIRGVNTLIQNMPDGLKKLFGISDSSQIKDVDLTSGLRSKLEGMADIITGTNEQERVLIESTTVAIEKKAGALADIKDGYSDFAKVLGDVGRGFESTVIDENGKAVSRSDKQNASYVATAMSTSGISGQVKRALDLVDDDDTAEALQQLVSDLTAQGVTDANMGTKGFMEAIAKGDLKTLEGMEATSAAFIANFKNMRDGVRTMSQQLEGGTGTAQVFVEEMIKTAEAVDDSTVPFAGSVNAMGELNAAFEEGFGGVLALKGALEELNSREASLNTEQSAINNLTEENKNRTDGVQEKHARELALRQSLLDIRLEQLNLDRTIMAEKLESDPTKAAAHELEVGRLNKEIDLLKKKSDTAKKQATDIDRIGLQLGNSLESGLTKAFTAMVDGTMSAKEAFASMAKSILADLAKMIIKMLVVKMIQDSLGTTSFGKFLQVDKLTARSGGVFDNGKKKDGYSSGGIASGSQGGYPAILHGTEAVVPLPNGNSIPVEMNGSAGQVNNIVINIDEKGNSSSQSAGADVDSEGLAKAVAKAVQDELHNQKRSGGILSPYGAA